VACCGPGSAGELGFRVPVRRGGPGRIGNSALCTVPPAHRSGAPPRSPTCRISIGSGRRVLFRLAATPATTSGGRRAVRLNDRYLGRDAPCSSSIDDVHGWTPRARRSSRSASDAEGRRVGVLVTERVTPLWVPRRLGCKVVNPMKRPGSGFGAVEPRRIALVDSSRLRRSFFPPQYGAVHRDLRR